MNSKSRESKVVLRELQQHFKLIKERESLLSFIDHSILRNHVRRNQSSGIESTFLLALSKLHETYALGVTPLCYVFMGDHLALLHEGSNAKDLPLILNLQEPLKSLVKARNSKSSRPRLLARHSKYRGFFKHFKGANTILMSPMYSPSRTLLCLFVVLDSEPSSESGLREKEFQTFFTTVVSQLSIAYNQFLRDFQKNNILLLWDLFLESDLSPSKCFRKLAMMIPSCLPSFGPLRLRKIPEVQILLIERSQNTGEASHLTVRATTGEEPDTTRIAIHDSITGLLVERPEEELPYFCDDPTKKKYGLRFKNYLGVGKNRSIKTELAVRLYNRSEFIGVLNLETHVRNAFSIHHIQGAMDLANQIAPMIAVFEDRLVQNKLTQYSLGATTARYLDSLASIFRHGIRTPLLNLRMDLDLVDASVRQDLPTTLEKITDGRPKQYSFKSRSALDGIVSVIGSAVGRLNTVRTQIDSFSNEFAGNISGFGRVGRLNTCETLTEVVNLTKNSLLQKLGDRIRIKLNCAGDIYIFCSPLIKQYLFCLLHNSVISIQERMKQDPRDGIISISVSPDTSAQKSQERILNERWVIRIHDNGRGVEKKQLDKLREFRFGTRFRSDAGWGYGLFATQRYVASVGGRVELNSAHHRYFEVLLYLDKYREELHGPLSAEQL